MMRTLSLFVVVSVVVFAGPASSKDRTYLTNIELVEKATQMAADSMKLTPPAGGTPEIDLRFTSPSDAAWLVENVLKEKVISAGWRLKVSRDSTDTTSSGSSGYVLKLRIVDLGLIYGKSWRRYLIVGKRVERIARATIFYDLEDLGQGAVIASSDVRGEVRDVVPTSALPFLSDAKYAFASPALEKSEWDRYVEGSLVLAIVGVLVYLFYSNKTAS